MTLDTRINDLIQKVRNSHLSDANKDRAIQILEAIRRIIRALSNALREHRDAANIIGLALVLAVLIQNLPALGKLLAFTLVGIGVAAAFVVEIRRALALQGRESEPAARRHDLHAPVSRSGF